MNHREVRVYIFVFFHFDIMVRGGEIGTDSKSCNKEVAEGRLFYC